jgi:hypothetical protein
MGYKARFYGMEGLFIRYNVEKRLVMHCDFAHSVVDQPERNILLKVCYFNRITNFKNAIKKINGSLMTKS